MKPAPSIPTAHLVRLRDEYRRDADRVAAEARMQSPGIDRRILEMRARVLGANAQDLDDLIKGLEHPSGRRCR